MLQLASCSFAWAGAPAAGVADPPTQLLRARRPTSRRTALISCKAPVEILVTGVNSRRISSKIVIQNNMDAVWRTLTDYDNLSLHVPNLIKSYRVPQNDGSIRVFQEGAQNVVGFDFSASLLMDMKEVRRDALRRPLPQPYLSFTCVESFFFQVFSGEWRLVDAGAGDGGKPATELRYCVDITPKGLVPAAAIEFQVKQEVPSNLLGLKRACEMS